MKGGLVGHLMALKAQGAIKSKRGRRKKNPQVSTVPSGGPKMTFHGKKVAGD